MTNFEWKVINWITGNKKREEAKKKKEPYAVLKEDGTELDTANMTEEEFTAIRPGHIGGSSVSAILGISPWITITEYYDQFIGVKPIVNTEFNAEAKLLGHENEEFVAQKFVSYMKRFHHMDIELLNDSRVFRNDAYPYAQVNLDRRIVKVNGRKVDMILECKTTSVRGGAPTRYWKKGICPPYYEAQVRFYLKVMKCKVAYICCCWGLTYDDMAVIKIEADEEQDKIIINACEDFISCVEQGVVPDETNTNSELWNNYYLRLNGAPDPEKKPVELPENTLDIVKEAERLQAVIEEDEAKLKADKKKRDDTLKAILPLLDGAEYGSVAEDDLENNIRFVFGVKAAAPMTKASFDHEKFAQDHPELFKQYMKVQVDTTALGKADKKLKAEYTIPPKVKGDGEWKFEVTKKEYELPKTD